MDKYLNKTNKKREETDGVEDEREQSRTTQALVAPTTNTAGPSETPSEAAPSTPAEGGRPAGEEPKVNSNTNNDGDNTRNPRPKPRKVCGAYRKKLRKQKREAEGNLRPPQPLNQQNQSRKEAKRKKGENDTPPLARRDEKRPRQEPHPRGGASQPRGGIKEAAKGGGPEAAGVAGPSGVPRRGATGGGGGLTAAQRANPLTVVATAEEYPECALTHEDFGNFRAKFRQLAKETPPDQMPRIEQSFGWGGVFIFIASDQKSKEWLLNKVAPFEYGGPKLRVGGVELIQKLYKASVWLPGPPEEPTEVLSRLEAYNPTLKTNAWRPIKRPQGANDKGRQDTGDKYVQIFQLPESQVRALEALDNRPWLELGRVTFRVSHQIQEGDKVEEMAVDNA